MFCPKCGQQQLSDDVRFCSRCGFQLNGVSQLLTNEGALTVSRQEGKGLIPYLRHRGALPGAKIMFFSLCLFPVAMGIGMAVDGPAALLISIIPFCLGLMQLLYMLIFGNHDSTAAPKPLPVSFQEPSDSYIAPRRMETSDLLTPPPSVTDHTTRLLEKDPRNDKFPE